jgi:hypothetical protein
MKIIKRLLLVILALVVLLIGAAIAIPYIYKDEILSQVKNEINKNVRAEVDFADVELSLLRSFPNLSLNIKDYTVIGVDEFEGQPLASGKSVGLTLDLMSVVKADLPVSIRSVTMDSPDINVYVKKNGVANYDIAVPGPDTSAQQPPEQAADYSNVVIELDRYAITNAHILYDDRSTDILFEASGLNHSGKGNFTIDVYDLDTHTDISELTVEYGGISYLKKALLQLDAIFNIDQANSKYTLKENELLLNALKLRADGFVQLLGDDIGMDLSFSTPQNDFKSLWSMIPNAYIEGYEEVKASGQFSFSGQVKGTYSATPESYPSFAIDLSVADANVQYPGLPMGISNITTKAKINSPGSDFDDLTVDVPAFKMTLGSNPFSANFFLKHPISDPDVKASARGVINLSDINKAFPVDGVDQLAGIIDADLDVNTRLSYIENEDYERVDMRGALQMKQFNYQGAGLPLVVINEMSMDFSPQQVNVPNFDGKLGQSDIRASGAIKNILAYFSPQKTMFGELTMRSTYFNVDEWMLETEESSGSSNTTSVSYDASANSDAGAGESAEIFDRFDFTLDAAIDKIQYDVYDIRNSIARGHMTPNTLNVSALAAQIGDSDFSGNGVITGLFDYVFEGGTLGGNLYLTSNNLNLNQFMPEGEESAATANSTSTSGSTSAEETAYSVIPVPPNIDMTINANIQKLTYTNIELEQLLGQLVVSDEAIIADNVTARGLGGRIGISGSYDTKDTEEPDFNFKYDLQQIDFQDAFNTFNTFATLAPIGEYIKGTFSSTMIMNGQLGKDLMPKIESLNAEGFLETINGVIQNFEPTKAIGEKLNLAPLKNDIAITNTKNWFEVVNGTLEIKEYDAKIDDINMKIGGFYSLASLLDLNIKAKIPRELLEQNAVGAAASKGLGLLSGEASKLGINLNQGKYVNVLVNLKGAITDPKVGIKLLGLDGDGDDASLTERVKEEVKEEAKEKLEDVKAEARARAEAEVKRARDSLERLAKEEARKAQEELERKAREEAEKALKDKVDSATQKKIDDALDKVGDDAKDKIEDHLKDFNPFKKKKKGGGK